VPEIVPDFRLPNDLIEKPFTLTEHLGYHKDNIYYEDNNTNADRSNTDDSDVILYVGEKD